MITMTMVPMELTATIRSVTLGPMTERIRHATTKTANKAPAKADPAINHPDSVPNAHPMVTANPAPAFTPIIPGEASLLFNTLCIMAPATANPAPANACH